MVGILLAGWYVRYVVRDNISHGVTRVLYAISQNKSRLKPHNMYSSVFASSITIGFGGSVGAEGPIVYTGAAIGSNLGQAFRLSPRILMIHVGCGAAAGIAGIFKAPIAGMLFTLEVLMLDLTTVSVMPLLIASISAATVERAVPHVAYSVCDSAWCVLRTCVIVFYPRHEHDGRLFQTPPEQPVEENHRGGRYPCCSRFPFPAALR